MSNREIKKNQRVIIHYPSYWLLNQFSYKSSKRKIVWNRKNKNPTEIALNEWPQNIFLKAILIIPFFSIVILTFIPVLLAVILLHFINKETSQSLHDNYFVFIQWLAKNEKSTFSYEMFDLANSYSKKPMFEGLLRVLFVEKGREDFLLKINPKKINLFIDEVWVFDSIERVIHEVVRKEYLLENSFISRYNENTSYCEVEWLNNDNEKIKAEKIKQIEINKLIEKANQPQHPRVNLNPNSFLNNNIVFYFESNQDKKVNDFIYKNYDHINTELNKKSMQFIYIPRDISRVNKSSDLFNYAKYFHPEVFSESDEKRLALLESVFDDFNIDIFYKGIATALNIPNMSYPVLLHSVELLTGINPNRNYSYSVYELKGADDDSLKIEIDYYLSVVSIAKAPAYRVIEPDYEDPDEMFPYHGGDLNKELKNEIDLLLEFKNEKILLSSILYIINALKESNPDLCKKVNKLVYETVNKNSSTYSRLYIDERYRIFLIDYNNIEIELTPLPKTLFLFMLKNPDGVKLKELSNYRKELIKIYSEIGNRLDMNQVNKSINDLIDATSNSVNEKCSRIKEAFVAKIDDSIAQQYYITGNRGENKRIKLDRSLVIFSQSK